MPREFQHIIRVSGADLDGTQIVVQALTSIKGVGLRMANIITKKAGINSNIRLGFLSDADIKKIENILTEPAKYHIPRWLLDRQKDIETGKDLHLTASDLVLQTKTDVDLLKKIRSWRGIRHAYGLKVRGQRTRTTGRSGKSVGVKKKRVRVS